MKHVYFGIVSCAILLSVFPAAAQTPYTAFEKQVNAEGFSIEPFARTSQIQNTGATLLAANANIGSLGDADMLFLRLDDQGNVIADHTYGEGSYHDVAKEAIWYDSHYYVTGYTRSTDTASNPTFTSFLIKLDSNLNMIWQQNFIFPGPQEIYANSMITTQNNQLLLAGQLYDGSDWTSFILRTDTAGTLQWFKKYSSPSSVVPMHIQCVREMSNGDIMVSGASSAGFQVVLPFACRFNAAGNFLWGERFNTPPTFQNSDFFFIQEVSPANVLLVGKTDYAGAGNMDFFVTSVDTAGALNWTKAYGGTQIDWPFGAAYDNLSGELVMTGHSGSFTSSSGTMRGMAMQIAGTNGSLNSAKLFGDTLAAYPLSIYNTNRLANASRFLFGTMGFPVDKIYFAGADYSLHNWCHTIDVQPTVTNVNGTTSSFTVNVTTPNPVINGNKLSDSNFSGVSVLCSSPLGIGEETALAALLVYPNPAGDNINLTLPKGFVAETISITDLTGRTVWQSNWSGPQLGIPQTVSDGMYLLQVIGGGKKLTARLGIQK